jgi:hypothetical protein
MMRILVGIATGLGLCFLLTGEEAKQKVQVAKTERMDFPSAGLLRLRNSTGELMIQGWDQPDIEITTVKSTKDEYDPQTREKAAHELDKVHVTAERLGEEFVVTTDFPRHIAFLPGGSISFDLEYDIKVPRNARLAVDHNIGGVYVDNVTGDIQVTAHQGEITLHLAENGQYAIDAKSDFGAVTSDFPGREKREPWLIGHQFTQTGADPAQKLFLRIGYGDIILLKMQMPAAPSASP